MSDRATDFAFKTFFRVGSLEIRGSNPEESLDTHTRSRMSCIAADFADKTVFGVGSLENIGGHAMYTPAPPFYLIKLTHPIRHDIMPI